MPLARLQVSIEIDEGKKEELLTGLTKVMVEVTARDLEA